MPAPQKAAAPLYLALDRFTDLERDEDLQLQTEGLAGNSGERLVCARCATTITSNAARCEQQGSHIHAFSNPIGVQYLIGCFSMAETIQRGETTQDHTWFPGFAWQVAHCPQCHVHLGWKFTGPAGAVFFGLISDRLREARQAAD